jgi:hypothetical protein
VDGALLAEHARDRDELAMQDPAYAEFATKFVEHFLCIASSMTHVGGHSSMWDEEDGFFYDVLRLPDRRGLSGCECDPWSASAACARQRCSKARCSPDIRKSGSNSAVPAALGLNYARRSMTR